MTLWDPMRDFGQLQNQAYGYLFPQGPFFLLADLAHVPAWVSERLWAVLLVVVGVEGARLLARSIGLGPWAAWLAGMAYGLNPRTISQLAVRSAEILPTAVLPWVALPVVLALTGRIGARRAAVLSAAAFMFSGAVNGTATAAGLPLVLILVVWGVHRRLVPRSMLWWWLGLVAVTNVWWAASLLRLQVYSPQFFDYVEDARATTEVTGWTASLRGLSNWVNYTYLGVAPAWPAGYDFAFVPALVLLSGLVAAVGVLGLVWLPRPWRAPLVTSATIGVVCLTLAHSGPVQSPVQPVVQDLLDGVFALLRNVSKADPLLRLPLSLGVGVVLGRALELQRARRTRPRTLLVGALVAGVLALAQPALAMNLRTPGWGEVPDYWQQTADYLAEAPGNQQSWLVPGSGFGLQTWGWTVDEPFQGVARTPWVSRSQVPLAPPQTIRVLSGLETFLESGSGSPNLGVALGRLGVGYVVVRHDLDEAASDTTTSNLVAIALARSRGVDRVATFGALDFGPAIEVFRVTSTDVAPDIEVRPLRDAVTVASASTDVLDAVVEGLIGPRQPAIVQGDAGWDEPAEVLGDSYRDRERNFGRVHDGEGPVRAAGEVRHGGRVVKDYPANEASLPLRAVYDDGAVLDASSSQGWTNGLGRIAPEAAPYSAFDDDPATGWRSAFFQSPREQYVEVRWPRAREIGRVTVRGPVDDDRYAPVTRWMVSAGDRRVPAVVDPFTGMATADLRGVEASDLRVSVDRVRDDRPRPVQVLDVASAATPVGRTLEMPSVDLAPRPSYVLTAHPETRACITTLLGADCRESRQALSEESSGIDRTLEVPEAGEWELTGTAVARARPGTNVLLTPLGTSVAMRASSQWLSDPAVAVRLAYDASTATSWVADPRDASPRLVVDFDRPRTLQRIAVAAPSDPAVSPTEAVLRARGGEVRRVRLDEFGVFAPLRTNRVTITFTNPTRGLAPIGVSELALYPGRVGTPLDGGDVTGSVCGLGPVVRVDGRVHRTEVRGFIGDVVSAGPLSFRSCEGPLRIPAGRHRVVVESTEQFQPVTVRMRSADRPRPAGEPRDLGRLTGSDTHQRIEVGPGEESILSTTRNLNAGWVATLDGERLEPLVSDGWAQAWRVPAGEGGTVRIDYAPQTPYLVWLLGGLAVALGVLLWAAVLLVRTRLAPARPIPVVTPQPVSVRRWWVGAGVLVPVAWVLGGLPAAGAVLVSAVVRRPPVLRAAAVALLVAAYALVAWQLVDGPRLRFDVADAVAGFAFVLALGSLAPPRQDEA